MGAGRKPDFGSSSSGHLARAPRQPQFGVDHLRQGSFRLFFGARLTRQSPE